MRFPRIVKVRKDKNWDEAMTKEEFEQMIADFGNKQRLMVD